MTIAVLALQGAFIEHEQMLQKLGVHTIELRLASDIAEQDETYFETIPMTVKRNAYGRQLGSFHTNAEAAGIGEIPMTFIRAPFVESVHADASENTPEILSIVEDRIVGVKYKNQIAFAFHPELDQDTRIHEAFLGMIR